MPTETYSRLIAGPSRTDRFDRHVFACAIAIGAAQRDRPLAVALGLSPGMLGCMVHCHFPHALNLVDGCGDGLVPMGPEEPDLRVLLATNGTLPGPETDWLAHIIARRAMESNHLWQDLGLDGRKDLSGLMLRHFAPLAAQNDRDMKWKKFFYRQLCAQEGVRICKSPICDSCTDFAECFGGEDGASLISPYCFPSVA